MKQADLDTLVISAVRYALGRMTYVVGDVARIAATADISQRARNVILHDLAEAIDRDDLARSEGKTPLSGGLPLGMNCDRKEWELLYADLRTRG